MIKILDYGMGNTASLLNMIRKAGGQAELCSKSEGLDNASAIFLPGVGAFDNGMEKLEESGLLDCLRHKVLDDKVPFLGVCLGMQLLFEKSEEGLRPGLALLKGNVTRFDFTGLKLSQSLKVPHMGWNVVHPSTYDNLYAGLEEEARFYFVHSYHVNCGNSSDVLATAYYGYEFPCSVRHENIWGAQFHPEKSHRFGIHFFKNFLKELDHA
ncbi:imidazole glycerol phosphate synthase subunit HisH [bacterium]|nr:imidazole glycerol phosphate synthase subunit HisH [bacterium]